MRFVGSTLGYVMWVIGRYDPCYSRHGSDSYNYKSGLSIINIGVVPIFPRLEGPKVTVDLMFSLVPYTARVKDYNIGLPDIGCSPVIAAGQKAGYLPGVAVVHLTALGLNKQVSFLFQPLYLR